MEGSRLSRSIGLADAVGLRRSLVKAGQLPFEQLPNLPKPLIPVIDLGIGSRTDIKAIGLPTQISDQKRIGLFVSDGSSQTDESHIVEVKQVSNVIEVVLQDVAQLRKDLNFALNVLRADYENNLGRRAAELYCRVNEKMRDIEKQQREKVERVRRSYRQQLVNAIQKIAGEYKAYYDELMSGKAGRHDLKIKELKEKVIEQEALLEVQALRLEELVAQINELQGQEQEDDPVPATPPGISMEEAEQLRTTIADLQEELAETTARLAAKENSEKKLRLELQTTTKALETERVKGAQLKRDMEGLRRKSITEQEKAARLAESQRAALEKEMKERIGKAQKDAALEAQRDAEQSQLQAEASMHLERERNCRREEELLAQQSSARTHPAMADGELEAEVAKLQLVETRQREEINKLQKELERVNRVWSTKLAIMQKNFHALRDESFLRSSLQRQAATLHHATLGYAVNSYPQSKQIEAIQDSRVADIDLNVSAHTQIINNSDNQPRTLTDSDTLSTTSCTPVHS